MSRHRPVPVISRIKRRWSALTLAGQFLLAGSTVLLAGMIILGIWVTSEIEDGVIRNSAAATALYVDSVIAPLLPDLQEKRPLSPGDVRALSETLSQGALGRRLASFKLWAEGGLIIYSSEPALIGRRFPPGEHLREAWAGKVAAEFDELDDAENATERESGEALLEIYSPIREPWSGEVVAVAEFYERSDELRDGLASARLRSSAIVAAVTLGMMGLLFGIVRRGSGIIASQREALEERVAELSRLLAQNEELRRRVQGASSRAVALNEQYLRRISADLHDGPAQLLALALLRLGVVEPPASGAGQAESGSIRSCLTDAMQEIRSICRGLVLPHIEAMTLLQLLDNVTAAHEQRTGTEVVLHLPETAPPLSHPEKICVFRFVQECLNNAFRHGGGQGQTVTAAVADDWLNVTVSDDGKGFAAQSSAEGGLGLAGLRERVESLGGEFHVRSSPSGVSVAMQLHLAEGASQ